MQTKRFMAIGLMSGTSMDGIDAALIETDGDGISAFGADITIRYDDGFRQRLRELLGRPYVASAENEETVRELTLFHADAVRRVLAESALDPDEVDVVGFHGQTVYHAPEKGITCQIGDGALLARETGITVINDFRSADVAGGGEGAPFAPLYHVALSRTLERPVAFLNLGGVGNVTWISPDGGAVAFDTGPANALIDDWTKHHTGAPYDDGGALARSGSVDEKALATLLDNPYFKKSYPKSLDRDAFSLQPVLPLSPADGAATLVAFTAESVRRSASLLPAPPLRWLVCGGGRHNPVLMSGLRARLGLPVEAVEACGWRGDALEAQAFAYLAVRSLLGRPLTYPQTTGVTHPTTGGVRHDP